MRSLGANLGATRANNFPRQADESEQAAGDQASWRTGSDNLERLTGIYRSEGRVRTGSERAQINSHFRSWSSRYCLSQSRPGPFAFAVHPSRLTLRGRPD
jgi:hypothetical protein